MAQRLSIILSFRNEEGNIPELLRRLRSTLNQIPELEHELIFVNDASTDNSLMMLMEEARQDRR
ncbi:glycosyltransferase, partial [bacterium]